MSLSFARLIKAGLNGVLDLHLVGMLAGDSVEKALVEGRDHLTLTGDDLGRAFAESLGHAAAAIALGLSSEERARSTLARLFSGSAASRAYSSGIQDRYLAPYAAAARLTEGAVELLREEAIAACQGLSQHALEVLPPDGFPEVDLVATFHASQAEDVTAILLALADGKVALSASVQPFLRHQGLLGDAFLFFFREKLRKDPRVERTLAHWERQGVWADVRDLKRGQQNLTRALQLRLDTLERLVAGSSSPRLDAQLGSLRAMLADLPTAHRELLRHSAAQTERLRQLEEGLGGLTGLVQIGLRELATGLDVLTDAVHQAREAAVCAADQAAAAARQVERLSEDLGTLASILEKHQADVVAALAEVQGRLQAPRPPVAGTNHPAPGSFDAIVRFLAYLEQDLPPFSIKLWTEPGKARATRNLALVPRHHRAAYRVGESVRVHFWADRPCFVHLLNIGPTGDLSFLFPNQFAPDHHVAPDRVYSFPREEDDFDFQLQPPAGLEIIKAIATVAPLNLLGIEPARLQEAFFSVPEERRLRNIAVMARTVASIGPAGWCSTTCAIDVNA